MGKYSHRSESDLRELYIEKDYTQSEIADKMDVSVSTVSKWMNKFNIETGHRNWSNDDGEEIIELYEPDKTFEEMADGSQYTKKQIRHTCIKHGVHDTEKETYSNEELIDQIESVFEEHGRVSKRLFDSIECTASASTVVDRFGSWSDAIDQSDAEISDEGKYYTRQEIRNSFVSYAKTVDTVTVTDFKQSEYGPSGSVKPQYENFEELLQESNISKRKMPTHAIEKDDIMEMTEDMDGPASITDIATHTNVSPGKLQSEFENTEKLFEECSIERKYRTYTEKDITDTLQDISTDGEIHPQDIAECNISRDTIKERSPHNTISNAVSYFGFEYKGGKSRYTDEELIHEMERCNEKHGDVKIGLFKTDDSLPSWMTYVVRFGSWANAKQRAGFEVSEQGREPSSDETTYIYGPEFLEKRNTVRNRAGNKCQVCGVKQSELDRKLDVHHITPVREFEDESNAHTYENLVALCHDCHMQVESNKIDCPEPPETE